MTNPIIDREVLRRSFGKVRDVADIPDLRDVQRCSYGDFLQSDVPTEKRKDVGLQGVFKSVFPIKDATGRLDLRFVKYELEPPKHDELECLKGGLTYSSSLKATLKLMVYKTEDENKKELEVKKWKFGKEQEVYMGTVPLMTSDGSFIINGTRRVIVSQVHRSPGVFYDHDKGKTHYSGKYLYAARIIPYRGSWLDFEFDAKDIMHLRIDRKRKMLVSTFLMALPKGELKKTEGKLTKLHDGFSRKEMILKFYQQVKWKRAKNKGWTTPFVAAHHLGTRPKSDIFNKNGEVLFVKGKEVTSDVLSQAEAKKTTAIVISEDAMVNYYLGDDINTKDEAAPKMGRLIGEKGGEKVLAYLEALTEISTLLVGGDNNIGSYLLDTFAADKTETRQDALYEVYKVVRAGEIPSPAAAEDLLYGLFFDRERYDLSGVGRIKLNHRLGIECPVEIGVLRKEDLFAITKTFMEVKDGIGDQEIDDIDNLGNRRVRSVGEVMETQYRIGLTRMARAMKERIGVHDPDKVTPNELVNAKAITSMVREFFGSSRLSQFMDQTNPLSEITHKRRLSALGPGGLTRERAGFDVRDVHPSHYGRICPIETPEGPNIGLINSLAIYTRVNEYGFIETPYVKVKKGKLTKEIDYLSAAEERKFNIARAGVLIGKDGTIEESIVQCHRAGEPIACDPEEVDYADVSPRQLVSVATALIPFLENDDANRALMGSNMQRQAVPLLFPQAPLVGTGMEGLVARDSGSALFAENDGVVDQVDATRIVVRHDEDAQKDTIKDSINAVKIYHLTKFQRSNQDTCVTQRPVVKRGDKVKQGQIIADGSSTEGGELALGRNLTVAFMVWKGYNFEDSIIMSDKVVRDDVFTSLHIQEFESTARDTKLGPEEITRDIPNAKEEHLRHLDEEGIVSVGAEVSAGDILVGKVTPKGESVMTPEEKLLCAIFGEKASDVKDISLTVPPGISGTVLEVRIFSRKGIDKDSRSKMLEDQEELAIEQDSIARSKIYEESYARQIRQVLLGATSASTLYKGKKLTPELLDKLELDQYIKINVKEPEKMKKLRRLRSEMDTQIKEIKTHSEAKKEQVKASDELPPGVLKMVKVFVAVKRKLQVGDKMAGRHGNKGVVSKIVPMEDMPYTEDGTPVDIILNPLGVPSRMNVGQILETHLGWAARGLGEQIAQLIEDEKALKRLRDLLGKIYKDGFGGKSIDKLSDTQVKNIANNLKNGILMATPVFEGASLDEIEEMLALANRSSQATLYDGRDGTPFARKVTVGTIYMLKLHHLVDDKIHARSTGPYSLVTQQPLGGKAQFGGQRFGEMEVWSLEAYGSAYVLQEMLTIKSDDIVGRSRAYEAIIRGDNSFESGIPESFNVLMVEMRALGLNAKLTSNMTDAEKEQAKSLPQPSKNGEVFSETPQIKVEAEAKEETEEEAKEQTEAGAKEETKEAVELKTEASQTEPQQNEAQQTEAQQAEIKSKTEDKAEESKA